MRGNHITAADLFCGAGGTSSGLYEAANDLGYTVDLLAVNHWHVAIKTHGYNHKLANHLCESLDNVDPRKVVPSGRLNILVASPECTHHSNARGGKPKSDQSRASAWHVLRWAEALRVDNIIVENVKEFRSWGPLGANGKPLKSKKGITYRGFLTALESLGYRVEDRVLNAADYGDATARERLFIVARRGNRKVRWPSPTHGPETDHPHRTAREIIDWEHPSQSIFTRKKALAPNTLRRIEAGLKKFCGEPFLTMLYGSNDARSLDRPCPTVTADGGHIGLCEPFLMHLTHHGSDALRCHSLEDPMPCVTGANRGEMGLVEPFLVSFHGGPDFDERHHSVDTPLPAQDTANRYGLCEPFILHQMEAGGCKSVDTPLPSVTTKCGHALVQPFLTKYYGTSKTASLDAPLGTVTAKARFGLVEPSVQKYGLDIRFRMLQPNELAAAMSLEDHTFFGTKTQVIKQIGNAVAKRQAKALCKAVLVA